MDLLDESKQFLIEINLPKKLTNNLCAYALIALTQMADKSSWEEAEQPWMGLHDIIVYLADNDLKTYAENSRESIRKGCIKPFRDMALVEDNGLPSNDKNYKYRLTDETYEFVKTYKTAEWSVALKYFSKYHDALIGNYQGKKELQKMPVRVNGQDLRFSPGKHNQLQKHILEIFKPKFAATADCLYVGDSSDRDLYKNDKVLNELGFDITMDIMPDIVLFDREKKWLYFIECVTSVGPVDEKRVNDISAITKDVDAGNVYITAFPDFKTYKKFSQDLAWDTEVWICEEPEHMIHLNGDRFMGPR